MEDYLERLNDAIYNRAAECANTSRPDVIVVNTSDWLDVYLYSTNGDFLQYDGIRVIRSNDLKRSEIFVH